jgi:HEAT repeat protein
LRSSPEDTNGSLGVRRPSRPRAPWGVRALAPVLIACCAAGCGAREKLIDRYLADVQSQNPVVRNHAIEQLGQEGAVRAAPELEACLASDRDAETRLTAVKALGNMRVTNSVPKMLPLLAEEDDSLRLAAIESLGKIREARAVPDLISMTSVSNVELVAIWALGNIGHTNAVPCLVNLLSDQDKFVRYNARRALGRIGGGK